LDLKTHLLLEPTRFIFDWIYPPATTMAENSGPCRIPVVCPVQLDHIGLTDHAKAQGTEQQAANDYQIASLLKCLIAMHPFMHDRPSHRVDVVLPRHLDQMQRGTPLTKFKVREA
jgi:hypothetical protein